MDKSRKQLTEGALTKRFIYLSWQRTLNMLFIVYWVLTGHKWY